MASKDSEITITKMPLNKIKIGRNSRANIDKDELEGLMESIKHIGLLQPIGVVKTAGGYDIAYGNRRFLACSKLGMTHIAAIIHTSKKASDVDIKNLAENVQRKNISLTEIGRYVKLLKGEGLSGAEIAIRLGASANYVKICEEAYSNVPAEFREDIVHSTEGKKRVAPGKIATNVALKIMNAKRSYGLTNSDEKKLFKAAKSDDNFEYRSIQKYAKQLKSGNDDFVNSTKPIKHIRLDFSISQDQYDKIQVKYVDDGPFNSVPALLKAVLMGKVALHIDILSDK